MTFQIALYLAFILIAASTIGNIAAQILMRWLDSIGRRQ